MTSFFEVFPSGDVDNNGWTLAGSVDTIWQALSDSSDSSYIKSPSHRGGVSVDFPVDVEDLPEGAIIDSVSVFVRMKHQDGSGPRAATINVRSKTNRGRYTSRTLHATDTFEDYEAGSYSHDPRGRRWNIHRLNQLEIRLFTRSGVEDGIRIARLWCKVNYHVRPTVDVVAPTGTVITPSPVITWNYSHEAGEPQGKAEYKIFTADQVETSTFNPRTETPVFQSEVEGEDDTVTLPTSLNADDYYVYVRVHSEFGARSRWTGRAFTVAGVSPGIPGDDNAGVSGTPGVGRPTVIPDSFTSSSFITMRDSSNLLSVQQADFEVPEDPLEYTATNATLARTTSKSYPGGNASLEVKASSAADMAATCTFIEVSQQAPMVARVQVRAASMERTVNLTVRFYDSQFAEIAGSALTGTGADSSSTWTEIVTSAGSSPLGAEYAKVEIEFVGPALNEVHYVDHVGLMYGNDTAWSDGGHMSRNMLTSHMAVGDDPLGDVTWASASPTTTVSRAAVSGTGAHGSKCYQMAYSDVDGTIGYRATGSVFTSTAEGTSYTLNKPAGVQDGDLLLAFITSNEHGGVTPPPGWDTVNVASVDDDDEDVALFVLKRTTLAGDPASWDGVLTVSSTRRTAVVVAYSGAALADDQFISDSVRTTTSDSSVHQTSSVHNSDPNAWRVSAFAASDDENGGSFSAFGGYSQTTTSSGSISYVGPARHWKRAGNNFESGDIGGDFKVIKPSGVQEGDLLIAVVSPHGPGVDFTQAQDPLPGWTFVAQGFVQLDDDEGLEQFIFKKTAGADEPNSWSGEFTGFNAPDTDTMVTQCVAYRGASDVTAQFIDSGVTERSNRSSIQTAEVTNTNSSAWRVCALSSLTNIGGHHESSEVRKRADDGTNASNDFDVTVSVWDSDGPVGTGEHQRTMSSEGNRTSCLISWIALIEPTSEGSGGAIPTDPETERVDNNNGSSSSWVTTAVYDSNGPALVGNQSVFGEYDEGGSGDTGAIASWVGIIRPATTAESGVVSSFTTQPVEISNIDPDVMELAGNKVTYMASFLGSSAGVPLLKLGFYNANQLITEVSAVGNVFDESVWNKVWAEFDIPEGTTRIRPEVGAFGRVAGDTVSFDRVGLMLGGLDYDDNGVAIEPLWRNGTARPEHPVWAVPVIEYADNDGTGYDPFAPLQAVKINPPYYFPGDGSLFYVDHTIVPLHNRKYRVKTISHGLAGDKFASPFGPESEEAAFSGLNWWLKDLRDLSRNLQLKVKTEPTSVGTVNTATAYQPIGQEYPVVVSEGYKSDSVELTLIMKREEHAKLKQMLDSRRTLLLQTDIDHSWWVRAVGDLEAETQVTSKRSEDPLRFVKVQFVEVKPLE